MTYGALSLANLPLHRRTKNIAYASLKKERPALPERMFTGEKAKNLEFIKETWHKPNYILATHHGARNLVKMAQEAQLEK